MPLSLILINFYQLVWDKSNKKVSSSAHLIKIPSMNVPLMRKQCCQKLFLVVFGFANGSHGAESRTPTVICPIL